MKGIVDQMGGLFDSAKMCTLYNLVRIGDDKRGLTSDIFTSSSGGLPVDLTCMK